MAEHLPIAELHAIQKSSLDPRMSVLFRGSIASRASLTILSDKFIFVLFHPLSDEYVHMSSSIRLRDCFSDSRLVEVCVCMCVKEGCYHIWGIQEIL